MGEDRHRCHHDRRPGAPTAARSSRPLRARSRSASSPAARRSGRGGSSSTSAGTWLAEEPLRGRSFSLNVRLPGGTIDVRVTAVDGRGRRSSRLVEPVFGLPRRLRAARARRRGSIRCSQRSLRTLVQRATAARAASTCRTCGPAAARPGTRAPAFPAASTLKLAIAVTVLRSLERKPESVTQSHGCSGRCSSTPTTTPRTRSRSGSPARRRPARTGSTRRCARSV